jgi:hypothetical protein
MPTYSETPNFNGSRNIDGSISYQREFVATLSGSGLDAVAAILSDPPVQLGDASPALSSGQYTIARLLDVAPVEGTTNKYKVSVSYDNSPMTMDANITVPDAPPWEEPSVISYDSLFIERAAVVDKAGAQIKNSAGDSFDPQPVFQLARPIIRVSMARETFNPSTVTSLVNTLNSSSQTIDGVAYAAKKLKMNKISAAKTYYIETPYYNVEYEIEGLANDVNDTFKLKLLDNGFRSIVSGVVTLDVDAEGNPPTVPCLLDGAGAKTTTPTFLEFEIYATGNWGGIDWT